MINTLLLLLDAVIAPVSGMSVHRNAETEHEETMPLDCW